MAAFDVESSVFGGGGGGLSASIPMTQLADTDFVDVPIRVPDGMTLTVTKWGVRTDGQTTPAGLTVSVYDYETSATVASESTDYSEVEVTLDGPADASLRVTNSTGAQLNAGGLFGYTIE